MTDIFDTKIMCKDCNVQMQQTVVERSGAHVRAVVCPKCGDKIIHPADLQSLEQFNNLKGKTFSVKLRMVGNSHAISIPKEIVDFMNEMRTHTSRRMKEMDEMVRLCFEDFDKLSLRFGEGFNNRFEESMEEDR